MSYLDTLKQQRAYAARQCDTIAFRMVMEGRPDAAEDLRTWSVQRDALDTQIAWMNRRTGWAWPAEPAWTD